MSLAILNETVTAVLLPDGWHVVEPGTFHLDAYEYLYDEDYGTHSIAHGGGQNGICATGFQFTTDDGGTISGPLTSILAVRT